MPRSTPAALALLLSGATVPEAPNPVPQPPPRPAIDTVEWSGPAGSATPNLTAGAGDRLVLTWLEPMPPKGRYAFRFAVREKGVWSPTGTIREADDFFVNWADFGGLVETGDGRWMAYWPQKTAAKPYAYHVMVTLSSDRGKTWSPPARLHDDTSATEHGFVAVSPGNAGLDALWLDGRNMTGEEPGSMTLRTRSLGSGPSFTSEIELDGRTCECCQTALARTSEGLIAAYRDRSDAEVRDIAVRKQVRGTWQPARVVAPDQWTYRACPVNGPALAAENRRVDLAWFTGVNEQPRVWLVRSRDAGTSFGSRIRIDEGRTLGRLDAEPLGDGSVLVSWLEIRNDQEAEWRIRRVTDAGAEPSRAVAPVSRARNSGFARLARNRDGVFLTFTATGPDGGVKVIRLAGLSGRHPTAQP